MNKHHGNAHIRKKKKWTSRWVLGPINSNKSGKNAKYEQSTFRFNIYLCEENPFISPFFIVSANLNLCSARCQYRFGRDNRAFEVPRPPPRKVIYSNALVKCSIFLHELFSTEMIGLVHGNTSHTRVPTEKQTSAWWPWSMTNHSKINPTPITTNTGSHKNTRQPKGHAICHLFAFSKGLVRNLVRASAFGRSPLYNANGQILTF